MARAPPARISCRFPLSQCAQNVRHLFVTGGAITSLLRLIVAEIRVFRGCVAALRLLDIAYAINLNEAVRPWPKRGTTPSSRSRLRATAPKAVAFDVPPLLLPLDRISLKLDDCSGRSDCNYPSTPCWWDPTSACAIGLDVKL